MKTKKLSFQFTIVPSSLLPGECRAKLSEKIRECIDLDECGTLSHITVQLQGNTLTIVETYSGEDSTDQWELDCNADFWCDELRESLHIHATLIGKRCDFVE